MSNVEGPIPVWRGEPLTLGNVDIGRWTLEIGQRLWE